MKLKTVLAGLVLLGVALSAFAATTKAIKSTRVNDYQVLVSCANGATPKAQDISGSIILSCEGRQE
jgi:hypothetical protein